MECRQCSLIKNNGFVLQIPNVQFVYLNGKVADFWGIFSGQREGVVGIVKFTFQKSRDLADRFTSLLPVASSSKHICKMGNPCGKSQVLLQIEKLRKLQIISFSHLFHVGFFFFT